MAPAPLLSELAHTVERQVSVLNEAWIRAGEIIFDHVTLRYRDDLPAALDSFSLRIAPGEKIGVVGRTGAGKSSIFTALFRLFELEVEDLGGIWIDGVDIAELGLHSLRRNISVIP